MVACQAPLSMGFSRQEYWSGWPFPSPRQIPDPGIEPRSPELQADSLPSEPPEKSTLFFFFFVHFLGGEFSHISRNRVTDMKNKLMVCWWWWSVTKLYPTLWDSMACSMPGPSILHYLPEFAYIHVHWCFCIVLKEILESSLDYKEIKSVNSEGNQPGIFVGRTDAEAETLILWPPDGKSRLIGKDPDDWERLRAKGEEGGKGWDG